MKLSYFPQIKVVHTSKIFHGQLYVPLANWLLMVGTVLVAVIYNNTTSLGNAYGVCVMFVTFFDTCMVSLAAMFVWRIKPYFVFLPWLTIACLDGTYLSASLIKVPDGAWFTLTLSGVLACLFILWRFGKENQWAAETADRFPTTHFVKREPDGRIQLTPRYGSSPVGMIKGFGIFFDKTGSTTPQVFSQFIVKLVAVPEVMVFFHIRPLETPSVPLEDRYAVSKLALPDCYRLVVRHGFSDVVITPDLASLIHERIREFVIHDIETRPAVLKAGRIAGEKDEETKIDLTEVNSKVSATKVVDVNTDSSTSSSNFASPENGLATDGNTQNQHITFGSAAPTAGAAPPADSTNDNATPPTGTQTPTTSATLAKLDAAYDHQVLYIMGKSQLKVDPAKGSLFRRVLLHVFLWMRENTRTKIASLKVSTDRVFEVGFVKDI